MESFWTVSLRLMMPALSQGDQRLTGSLGSRAISLVFELETTF
jgi:hypothetical protein